MLLLRHSESGRGTTTTISSSSSLQLRRRLLLRAGGGGSAGGILARLGLARQQREERAAAPAGRQPLELRVQILDHVSQPHTQQLAGGEAAGGCTRSRRGGGGGVAAPRRRRRRRQPQNAVSCAHNAAPLQLLTQSAGERRVVDERTAGRRRGEVQRVHVGHAQLARGGVVGERDQVRHVEVAARLVRGAQQQPVVHGAQRHGRQRRVHVPVARLGGLERVGRLGAVQRHARRQRRHRLPRNLRRARARHPRDARAEDALALHDEVERPRLANALPARVHGGRRALPHLDGRARLRHGRDASTAAHDGRVRLAGGALRRGRARHHPRAAAAATAGAGVAAAAARRSHGRRRRGARAPCRQPDGRAVLARARRGQHARQQVQQQHLQRVARECHGRGAPHVQRRLLLLLRRRGRGGAREGRRRWWWRRLKHQPQRVGRHGHEAAAAAARGRRASAALAAAGGPRRLLPLEPIALDELPNQAGRGERAADAAEPRAHRVGGQRRAIRARLAPRGGVELQRRLLLRRGGARARCRSSGGGCYSSGWRRRRQRWVGCRRAASCARRGGGRAHTQLVAREQQHAARVRRHAERVRHARAAGPRDARVVPVARVGAKLGRGACQQAAVLGGQRIHAVLARARRLERGGHLRLQLGAGSGGGGGGRRGAGTAAGAAARRRRIALGCRRRARRQGEVVAVARCRVLRERHQLQLAPRRRQQRVGAVGGVGDGARGVLARLRAALAGAQLAHHLREGARQHGPGAAAALQRDGGVQRRGVHAGARQRVDKDARGAVEHAVVEPQARAAGAREERQQRLAQRLARARGSGQRRCGANAGGGHQGQRRRLLGGRRRRLLGRRRRRHRCRCRRGRHDGAPQLLLDHRPERGAGGQLGRGRGAPLRRARAAGGALGGVHPQRRLGLREHVEPSVRRKLHHDERDEARRVAPRLEVLRGCKLGPWPAAQQPVHHERQRRGPHEGLDGRGVTQVQPGHFPVNVFGV